MTIFAATIYTKEMTMKKFIIPLLLLAAGCSKETPDQPVYDYLVRAELVNTMNKDALKTILTAQGYGQYAPLLQSNVRLLRVAYATEYPKGTKINVSGALLISENYDTRFPTVVYHHGTYGNRNSAPSLEIGGLPSMEVFLGITMASAFNCALLIPDYIGYGESKSVTHPYTHGESLGQTSLDFLRACREYMADPAVALPFNNNIFITGYSEGGYASVALNKAIDAHPAAGLKVFKTVAGAGAYDLAAFSKAVVGNPNPLGLRMLSSYLWVIGMYKTDFRYSKNYADIFFGSGQRLAAIHRLRPCLLPERNRRIVASRRGCPIVQTCIYSRHSGRHGYGIYPDFATKFFR
jgi:hypothetical protein